MKKLVAIGLAVGLVMVGVLVGLLGPWPCRVTRANREKIKVGMTQEEVHAILGAPGDYRTRPPANRLFASIRDFGGPPGLVEKWEGDVGTVRVDYHFRMSPGTDTVMLATFESVKPPNPGPVALATWRLKRLKERWLP